MVGPLISPTALDRRAREHTPLISVALSLAGFPGAQHERLSMKRRDKDRHTEGRQPLRSSSRVRMPRLAS